MWRSTVVQQLALALVRCTISYTARVPAGQGDDGRPSGDDELWLPPLAATRPRRRPPSGRAGRRPLSRDQIVQAAIAIADREGAEAVGMRRIARELDAGNMSIYWHVANKDELLALMIDAVEGEFEIAGAIGQLARRPDPQARTTSARC